MLTSKNTTYAALLGGLMLVITNSPAMSVPHAPICIAPKLTLECFVDKLLSVPVFSSFVSTGIGFWCLKKSIENWIERDTLTLANGSPITHNARIKKAREYGIAAISLIGFGALLYWRSTNSPLEHKINVPLWYNS